MEEVAEYACPECGVDIPADAILCPSCGIEFATDEDDVEEPLELEAEGPEAEGGRSPLDDAGGEGGAGGTEGPWRTERPEDSRVTGKEGRSMTALEVVPMSSKGATPSREGGRPPTGRPRRRLYGGVFSAIGLAFATITVLALAGTVIAMHWDTWIGGAQAESIGGSQRLLIYLGLAVIVTGASASIVDLLKGRE